MPTDKVQWYEDGEVTKSSLSAGVTQWCRLRTRNHEAEFSYLKSLTYSDLMLLARAMGFRPRPSRRKRRLAPPPKPAAVIETDSVSGR